MKPLSPTARGIPALLVLNGLCAATIGGLVVFAPQQLFALTGVSLGADPNLLSEIRAPGGVLLLAAAFITTAAFLRSLRQPALAVSAFLYLGYGFGRVVSVAVDGIPAPDLLWALAIETVLGGLSLMVLIAQRDTPPRTTSLSLSQT